MKKVNIFGSCIGVVVLIWIWTSSIYDFSIISIEGVNKPLSAYQGKKMMIITLPTEINNENNSLLYSLDSLGDAHESSLIIIGVPSYEDGYTDARKEELKQWYRNYLDTGIVVSQGLYVRSTSGSLQNSMFHWLTHYSENEHFSNDVTGPWIKFMIRSNGELFGVLGVHTSMGSATINRMLQTQ